MPVRLAVTAGTVADCSQALPLIEGIKAEHLLADKAYDTNENCQGRRQNIPVGRSKSVPPERSLASVNVRASCSGEVSQRQAGNRLGG